MTPIPTRALAAIAAGALLSFLPGCTNCCPRPCPPPCGPVAGSGGAGDSAMPGGPATRGPGMPVVAKPGKRFQLDNGTFAIFDPGNNVVGWVHSTDLNGPREEFWAFTPSYMKPRCSISPDLPTGISIRCTPETMGLTYAQFRDYAMQHGATTFSKTMPVDLSQLP